MSDSEPTGQPQVVVAGGGIAGLEALLALTDLAAERVALTLVAPEPDFIYKPLVVDEPFSLTPAERRELEPLASELGARFVRQPVTRVRGDVRTVDLGDGSELGYDALVVCVGGSARPVYARAATFWATGEPLVIDRLLEQAAASSSRRLVFVVPPRVTWSLPLYEVALMSERRARAAGLRDLEFMIVTPESSPLVLFGRAASDAVAELLKARGIRVRTGASVREEDGAFVISPGHERLEAGAVIALPVIEGPALSGLPADANGFIPIDQHARVKGLDAVYAAGDGTNFPIKQGGIGTQQADAAAEHIAARFGASVDPEPFKPVLRGKLITGDETLNMRANVAGGGGEGVTSPDYLWWPPHKVSGRYLAPFLAGATPHRDPEPPSHPIDVEIALPTEWHREPMALDPFA
jgi:sulfide:quinone oxidoreductase